MAIGFIYGSQLNETLTDPTYFTISSLVINTTEGKGVQTVIPLYPCPTLSWMGSLQSFYQNLSCLNTSLASLQGILYASAVSLYPRFIVAGCNMTATPTYCQNYNNLSNMTSGGRIFLFIQK